MIFTLAQISCAQVIPVMIEGIFIRSSNMNEVIECHQPGVYCFDLSYHDYFFTLSVNGKINLKDYNAIYKALSNPEFQNLEVFSFPPFTEYCNNLLKSQNIVIPQQANVLDFGQKYYCFDNDSLYLYQYMHFKASALRTIIMNDYLDKTRIPCLVIDWGISPNIIDLNIPGAYNYLLYDIEVINDTLPEWLSPFDFN